MKIPNMISQDSQRTFSSFHPHTLVYGDGGGGGRWGGGGGGGGGEKEIAVKFYFYKIVNHKSMHNYLNFHSGFNFAFLRVSKIENLVFVFLEPICKILSL